jgi:hypothetical protein
MMKIIYTVDEMIVSFKGRSSLKQDTVLKPTKSGLRICVRSGVSGYVHFFEPYQGNSSHTQTSKQGLGRDVAIHLCCGLEKKNAKVYFDNLFTSITPVKTLAKKNIDSVGTLHANRLCDSANKLQ